MARPKKDESCNGLDYSTIYTGMVGTIIIKSSCLQQPCRKKAKPFFLGKTQPVDNRLADSGKLPLIFFLKSVPPRCAEIKPKNNKEIRICYLEAFPLAL
ncbi:MAG: hypothetical protein D3916_04440 [Candidatus Electrothrix sp. MAN1_4]|nr:hypothetical protein [Candidatus Electrothrix sp. MAN1_4]